MAFKLTYSDGQATDYDDSTKWEVENGVVKMGREAGKWTVFISPSHWATLELVAGKDRDKDGDGHQDKGQGKHKKGKEHDEQDKDD
ncbi:hypothetical protein [Mycobacterium sp.]|jgi:hypothetical protein|uniref:hypothetical protein n=1 Tax=Mycobacterium sp. TaxID=1785 RepID=UPI003F99D1EF